MNPVENETLLKQLRWRYATQKFDPAKMISDQDWATLEQALILTASSYGLQPWHFVVVRSQHAKASLVAASYGRAYVADASHLVVFTVKKNLDQAHVDKHLKRIADVCSVPLTKLEKYRGIIMGSIAELGTAGTDEWSARQVYIAVGNLLTCAALLGIDACPMEGIEPAKYDQTLRLTEKGYGTLMVVALGYRAVDDPAATRPKVRFDVRELVTHL